MMAAARVCAGFALRAGNTSRGAPGVPASGWNQAIGGLKSGSGASEWNPTRGTTSTADAPRSNARPGLNNESAGLW